MKRLLIATLLLNVFLQKTYSAEHQPSKLVLNMGILGTSALLTYGFMQRCESKVMSACAAGGVLFSTFFYCVIDGWSAAHKEHAYRSLSLRKRISRILYHTGQVLKSSQGTDSIGQLAGIYCLIAAFWPQYIAFCSE